MLLKAKTKINGEWKEMEMPSDCQDVSAMSKFLGRIDGTDTIIIDEVSKEYYCGTNELVELCRRQGKSADILLPLAVKLFH